MKVDISVDNLPIQLGKIKRTISELIDEEKAITAQLNSLNGERNQIQLQLKWQDKYLMGFLGGDRLTVQHFKSIETSIYKQRNGLKEIEKKLKIENETLNKLVSEYLSNNSLDYKKINEESNLHLELYNSSRKYYYLLTNAKSKIDDALLLTSWDSLLKHPSAKEGLNKFTVETTKYQSILQAYEANLNVNLLDGANLTDFIKLSSERIARDGFNRIISQVKKNMTYTETRITESKKLKKSLVEFVISQIH